MQVTVCKYNDLQVTSFSAEIDTYIALIVQWRNNVVQYSFLFLIFYFALILYQNLLGNEIKIRMLQHVVK